MIMSFAIGPVATMAAVVTSSPPQDYYYKLSCNSDTAIQRCHDASWYCDLEGLHMGSDRDYCGYNGPGKCTCVFPTTTTSHASSPTHAPVSTQV